MGTPHPSPSDRIECSAMGAGEIVRDEDWQREVRYEVVRGVAVTEHRALVANLFGWAVMGAAAMTMPNAEMFLLPLMARAAAIFGTRSMWNRLRQTLEAGKPVRSTLYWLGATLAFGGASWALMVLPIMIEPFLHPARIAIGAGTFLGIGLVGVLLCPLPKVMAAFFAGFSLTVTIGLFFAPPFMALPAFFLIHGIMIAVVAFSYASSRQRVQTAEMLVDNRRLSENLAEALGHAEFLMNRDALTGLRNRRCLFEEEWPQLTADERMHILTIDLDHFKDINDEHGHAVGDQVLVAVGEVLRDFEKTLPGGPHFAARLGGEEFVFLVTNLDRSLAISSAELVRARIEGIGAVLREAKGAKTSASIGVSSVEAGQSLDAALARSDLAMYRAKERGRNRVEAQAA